MGFGGNSNRWWLIYVLVFLPRFAPSSMEEIVEIEMGSFASVTAQHIRIFPEESLWPRVTHSLVRPFSGSTIFRFEHFPVSLAPRLIRSLQCRLFSAPATPTSLFHFGQMVSGLKSLDVSTSSTTPPVLQGGSKFCIMQYEYSKV